jgi:protein O-GlcNAc transferase
VTLQQLFDLALQHRRAGRLADAESLCRQILSTDPRHTDALHLLGVLAIQAGRQTAAIELIRQALVIRPDLHQAHYNLAIALSDVGQLDAAIASYHQAIALKPNFPDAYNNLAIAYRDSAQLDAAIAAARQAIALRPNYADAYNHLGMAFKDKGQLDDAIAAFRQALAITPDFPEALNNLGAAFTEKSQRDQAITAFHQAIALRPDYPEAFNNLSIALRDNNQLDDSIAAARQAIAFRPNYPQAHNNLGTALKEIGQLDQAIACWRHALSLNPNLPEIHSNLVYALSFHPDYNSAAILRESQEWDRRHAQPLKPSIQHHDNDRSPNRRLRIGYVSPDFRAQAESFFVVPLLESHDHSQFEIHCYSSVTNPDAITHRLQKCADVWHDCAGLSDAQLASQIRRDRIDILIDLTLHMARNRLLTFARKPAPIQFSWLAYPGTTGLQAIDYRLTDSHLDPSDDEFIHYSEHSIRLPDSWICYHPLIDLPVSSTSPCQSTGFIRFGSLNHPSKLNDPLLKLWAQVLLAVPRSQMLILCFSQTQRDHIRDAFATSGIDPTRIEFVGRHPRPQYLRLYDRIDICLDTIPYNGITTTCDALWMNVPVITLTGQTPASRAGHSILANAGLSDLVARTPDQFIQIASQLAADRTGLQSLRTTLRNRFTNSAIMNAPAFARQMESVYRQLWSQWCLPR